MPSCTAHEVALRNDADQLPLGVDDRQAADVVFQQRPRRLRDGSVHGGGDDLPGHDLMGAHRNLSGFDFVAIIVCANAAAIEAGQSRRLIYLITRRRPLA